MRVFVVLACLLGASHGKRVQQSTKESPLSRLHVEQHRVEKSDSSPEATPPSANWLRDAHGHLSDKSKTLAAHLLALHPASAFSTRAQSAARKGLQRERVIDAANDRKSNLHVHQEVQPKMMSMAADASEYAEPPAAEEPAQGDSHAGWWAKALLLRWGLLAGVTTAVSRSGVLSPRMSASEVSDDNIQFSDEDKDFFANRDIKPSRREAWLSKGVGSLFLILGTLFSMVVANSNLGPGYVKFWDKAVGFGPLAWHLTMPIRDWINEAMMAFFFFLVGMEIKREFLFGSLSSLRKASLPCVAALGGMVVPTAIYCLIQAITKNPLAGWAIPMATDIAFAMGVYNLFRTRLPAGAAAFLLTLATVDDLGAIAVIAIAFAKQFNPMFFAGAGFFGLILEIFRRRSMRNSKAYTAGGAALWYCLLRSGVNADIAGVVAGFAIPAISAPRHTKAPERFPSLIDHYIHCWVGWANFLIMPLFAIANTAVPLGGGVMNVARSPVSQGILAGLLIGKPLGIAGSSLLALKLGWCEWPTGMKPFHLAICGLLGGIAFTMSLFLIEQSLVGPAVSFAKLAVIFGSTVAAVIAACILSRLPQLSDSKSDLPKEDTSESADAS